MITNFKTFESIYKSGDPPKTGEYVIMAKGTYYYSNCMIGKIVRVTYDDKKMFPCDIYFVTFSETIDDKTGKETWFKFEACDFLCWSKNKKELLAYMKEEQFDL